MRQPAVMIITGTSKGVGLKLAEHCLATGYKVAGCSRGKTEIKNDAYSHYQLDVYDEKAVKSMVADVYRKHGRIDALVNNAGSASMNAVMLTPLSTVESIFKSNVFGTFLFCREVAKIMMRAKHGRIINVSSIAVPLALEGEAVYASSKGAIETFTRVLAKEVGTYNITCNTIGLSLVETDAIKSVPPEKIQNVLDRLSIKRPAVFDDIINTAEFFISERSAYITGQTIYLGGV